MSHPNQHNQQSSQNGLHYHHHPTHYPSDLHQDSQARGHMNAQNANPTNDYPNPRLPVNPQPSPLQPTMYHQPVQQTLPDDSRQSYQALRYIPTPPPVEPGVFHNPNPSPFTTTPRTAVQNTSPPPPIRFQCDKCGTTFSRMHDRNRHYESTHAENPPVHKCERCRKQFSRADAKKRHQDDGKCVSSP